MADNDFFRHKREREFQRRMLAALEKPKPNKVLAFFNSRLTLWIITAVFITFGGTYLTRYQQCTLENEQSAERYTRLNREIHARREGIASFVEQADSIDSLKSSLKIRVLGRYVDFQDRSLNELEAERFRLVLKIDFTRVEALQERLAKDLEAIQVRDLVRYGSLAYLQLLDANGPFDLRDLKKVWGQILAASRVQYQSSELTEYAPMCSPKSLLFGLLGVPAPTISARPNFRADLWLSFQRFPNLRDMSLDAIGDGLFVIPPPFLKTDPDLSKRR